jgi:hypothetical protein
MWIATFVALVFLIGGLAGVVVDRLWLLPSHGIDRPGLGLGFGPGPGPGMGPGGGPGAGRGLGPGMQNPARIVAELDERLGLSADQEEAILRILDDWRPRVQDLQNASRLQFTEMQQQLQAAIATTLTPDQAARLKEIGLSVGGGGRGPRGGGGPGGGGR